MKKMIASVLIILFSTSTTVMAYGYVYDSVDAMANMEQAMITAQEQADVNRELSVGDFRDAQRIIQQDEAVKNQIRQSELMYDSVRDLNLYNYNNAYSGYGYYGR